VIRGPRNDETIAALKEIVEVQHEFNLQLTSSQLCHAANLKEKITSLEKELSAHVGLCDAGCHVWLDEFWLAADIRKDSRRRL